MFYDDLVMNPCGKLEEVRSKAIRFIRLEEDKEVQKRTTTPNSYDHPNRKSDAPAQRPYKKPYSRPEHQRVNALDDVQEETNLPNISDYCFLLMPQELYVQ